MGLLYSPYRETDMRSLGSYPWWAFCCKKMDWSKLNRLQLGKYGEYLAKMEFTKHGFDVYTAEVDDKGIDFVIRNKDNRYYDIQVKSIRTASKIFMRKEVFKLRENLYLSLLIFKDKEEPTFLLVPSLAWENRKYSFFVDKDYEGKKSKPEFCINNPLGNLLKLQMEYSFEKQVSFVGQ